MAGEDDSWIGLDVGENGFHADLTSEQPGMWPVARGIIRITTELWKFFEQPTSREQARRAMLTLQLVGVITSYIEESDKAAESSATYAQSVIACSIVESILMLVCLKEHNRVTLTKPWRKLANRVNRSNGRLSEVLPFADLNTLIAVGEALGWFETSLSKIQLLLYASGQEGPAEFPTFTPREALGRLQHLRNSVHPGRAIREQVQIGEKTGRECVWLAGVSLAGVLYYAQDGESSSSITLPVHPILRPVVKEYGPLLLAFSTHLLPEVIDGETTTIKQAADQDLLSSGDKSI